MKIKVGIFFGGPSREREISFAGGRTVYDNLNKAIFEPVPIFVDSQCNFILLEWSYLYKGTIRDFFPPIAFLPDSPHRFQIYLESLGSIPQEQLNKVISSVGRKITPEALPNEINIAFLALHGVYGEDGQIQQLLDDLSIPYTGSGVKASQIGMDKALQKDLMSSRGFVTPSMITLERDHWLKGETPAIFQEAVDKIGFPIVIRPANQGSSIGVSIIPESEGAEGFERAVNQAFFVEHMMVKEWTQRNAFEREDYVRILGDIREGLGFPLTATIHHDAQTIYHPESLLTWLNEVAATAPDDAVIKLESHLNEEKVILESFIKGKEFSCVVIVREDGVPVALPPTEIIKGHAFFDYRSKYMPGFSRKVTPIDLPVEDIELIRLECERLFTQLGFQTYARIDGFFTDDRRVFLNDPNTTSGMLPSSFFFHQAAEIGLNPSQFLTFIIRISLQERLKEHPDRRAYQGLMNHLDSLIATESSQQQRKRIAIILGGYSFERHISVESGRNIFEKLSSSTVYEPIPVFLMGSKQQYELHQIPINLLLKDNADDIRDKVLHYQVHEVIATVKHQCQSITQKYASKDTIFEPQKISYDDLKSLADGVFIALHGRPGEDGQVQMELEARNLPYNGSGIHSSSVTINKYQTLQTLKRNGFTVAEQLLMDKAAFEDNPRTFFQKIELQFSYPFIAKPVDDGCSSAVRLIHNRDQLEAYTTLIFRTESTGERELRRFLKLKPQEEFPIKSEILFEERITAQGANRFLEITGGLLTHFESDGAIRYEMFEPSEALASDEVLSLEEKFLAGEGQNLTPARFSDDEAGYAPIANQVKQTLEKAARILDIKGYARIDAFVRVFDDGRAETIIIEVNSLPGMTPATAIFHQAAINHYKPYDFIHKVMEFAFSQQHGQPVVPSTTTASTTQGPSTFVTIDDLLKPQAATTNIEETTHVTNSSNTEQPNNSPTMQSGPVHFFSSFIGFFRSSIFLKNCLGIIVATLVSFFVLTNSLNWYTQHGKSIEVKDFINMNLEDAEKLARRNNLRLVVSDSIFMLEKDPNVIIDQTPKENARVKENRRVYVSVTSSTAPMVPLPGLVGNYDYEQYARKLERLGIKYNIKEKQYDRRLEANTILYFFYEDEKITDSKLRRGIKVPKGSTLEFVVTERNNGMVSIPELICKRYKAASFMVNSMDLQIGETYGPVSDEAYVYKQEPEYTPGVNIKTGTAINLYLMEQRPIGCPEQIEPSDLEIDTSAINN